MFVVVNGEKRELSDGLTIAELLERHNLKPPMVVVERNGEIAPRESFSATILRDGDVLEIVQMMAGG